MRSPSVEGLCLLGIGERPQFLQLECPPKTFTIEVIESLLTSYHGPFRKVLVSFGLFLTSNSYVAVMYRYITDPTIGPFSRIKRKTTAPIFLILGSRLELLFFLRPFSE